MYATSPNVVDKLITKNVRLSNIDRHTREELQELYTDTNNLNESDIDASEHDDTAKYDDSHELNIDGCEYSDISILDTDEYACEN